jgi:hypothetical protein
MFDWFNRRGARRKAGREPKARNGVGSHAAPWKRALSWPVALGFAFVMASAAITMVGEAKIDYVVGQQIDQPIYAKVDFQVPDPARTKANREAARADTPSYYLQNKPALTFERIRADLMRVYQAAADAAAFEDFQKSMDTLKVEADRLAYDRLKALAAEPDDAGREVRSGSKSCRWRSGIAEDLRRAARAAKQRGYYCCKSPPSKSGRSWKGPHAQVVPTNPRRWCRAWPACLPAGTSPGPTN